MTSACPGFDNLRNDHAHLRNCATCSAIVAIAAQPSATESSQCEDYQLLLAVLLDGELQPDDEARLLAHLADCARCRTVMGDSLLQAPEDASDSELHWQGVADEFEPVASNHGRVLGWAAVLVAIAAVALGYLYTGKSQPADTLLARPQVAADQDASVPELSPATTVSPAPAPGAKSTQELGASRPRLQETGEADMQTVKQAHPTQSPQPCPEDERLSRRDITEAIAKIRAQVSACGKQFPDEHNTYKIRMKISDGRVSEASSNPDDELGSCVLEAVRQAHFPRVCQDMTVIYPFAFR